MSHRKYFPFVLLVAAIFLLDPPTGRACSCAQKPTVLDEYEWAGFVVIARAVSVEKTDDKGHVNGVSSTDMVVEKVFKGSLKVGEKMTFAQGGGANCIWTFSEESVGERFLFYLRSGKEVPDVWMAGTCGRSRPVEYAVDDLLYLNNMAKRRGKSRISGTLSLYQSSPFENGEPIYKTLGGKKVRILGKAKTYEVTTNKDGVYEIYDLPAGSYEIRTRDSGWLEAWSVWLTGVSECE